MAATPSTERPTVTAESVRAWLVEAVASRTGVAAADVHTDRHLEEFGLDSAGMLVLTNDLAQWTGVEVDPAALWYFPTIGQLAGHVAGESARPA
jgi:acyl carrier protein